MAKYIVFIFIFVWSLKAIHKNPKLIFEISVCFLTTRPPLWKLFPLKYLPSDVSSNKKILLLHSKPREVILKSHIWEIWKLAQSYNIWCKMTLMIGVILFQTLFAHIWEIYYSNFERFIKNDLTRSIFELEKCSFFLNGSEFRQKLIGTIIRVLVRHLRA